MTLTEFHLASQQTFNRLGFALEWNDTPLDKLVRQTTPRRFTRAVETVAGDESCGNAVERYNALVRLLESKKLARR
jgi:hypothetical protein